MRSDRASGEAGVAPAGVRVITLGRFALEVDGQPLKFGPRPPRRPLQLLKALVALGGEGISTETLGEALWPDADGDSAYSSLTVTLTRLRRLIGQDTLWLQDGRLTLDSAHCWVDVTEVSRTLDQVAQALGRGDADQAVSCLDVALTLYGGPFLEGEFELAPVLSARSRLHERFLRQIEDTGAALRLDGQIDTALALYRRALESDDQAESLYRHVMQICLETGRIAEGLAAFRRCRDILHTTLDVAPAAETHALYEALRAAGTAVPAPETPPAALELVGDQSTTSPIQAEPTPLLSLPAFGGTLLIALLVAVLGWSVLPERWLPWKTSADSVLPLPAQPSVAVLPFTNLSGDPGRDYLGNGISDELIARLATLEGLRVIAGSSSFAHSLAGKDIRHVGKVLGVRFVITGSVLRADDRVRLSAALVDTQGGNQLWGKTYERDSHDLFSLQDDLTQQVLTALRIPLVMGAEGWVRRASTDNLEAWEHYLRGQEQLRQGTTVGNMLARFQFEQAVRLDPSFTAAILGIAWAHYRSYRINLGGGGLIMVEKAQDGIRQAVALGGAFAEADALQASIYVMKGNHAQALAYAQRATERSPGAAEWQAVLAEVLAYSGRNEEALAAIRAAMERNPITPERYLEVLGGIYYNLHRYEDATATLQPIYDRHPQAAHEHLAASYAALGRPAQAREAAAGLVENLAIYSTTGFPLAAWVKWKHPYRDSNDSERLIRLLTPLMEP